MTSNAPKPIPDSGLQLFQLYINTVCLKHNNNTTVLKEVGIYQLMTFPKAGQYLRYKNVPYIKICEHF